MCAVCITPLDIAQLWSPHSGPLCIEQMVRSFLVSFSGSARSLHRSLLAIYERRATRIFFISPTIIVHVTLTETR